MLGRFVHLRRISGERDIGRRHEHGVVHGPGFADIIILFQAAAYACLEAGGIDLRFGTAGHAAVKIAVVADGIEFSVNWKGHLLNTGRWKDKRPRQCGRRPAICPRCI